MVAHQTLLDTEGWLLHSFYAPKDFPYPFKNNLFLDDSHTKTEIDWNPVSRG